MSQVTICDFCLKEIKNDTTRVSAQTVHEDGTTAANETASFDFHPRCFNKIQDKIISMRTPDPEPIEPEPVQPEPQPEPTPEPEPAPEPEPVPEPTPEPVEEPTEEPTEEA